MVAYYDNLMHQEGRAGAMRLAARAVKRAHPHPYYWAPFIVIGREDRLEGAEGAAIPLQQPVRHGITVTPVNPPQPIIIGPH
jgi:hypothetical protein